jgi:cytochrome c peroxidase
MPNQTKGGLTMRNLNKDHKAGFLPLMTALGLAMGVAQAAPPDLPRPVVDEDFYDDGAPPTAKVELGRLLFFDKVLSGNRNISCATCHHPAFNSGDGLALPLGEGAHGLGIDRRTGLDVSASVSGRVPRNSPGLFNLGAGEFERLFHDGRVETDTNGYFAGGFLTPAKWKLPEGLDNALAAQAMFPVTSPAEMAGDKGENPIADAASLNNAAGKNGVWELIAKRLRDIPEYVDLFTRAYPVKVTSRDDITYVLAANAIAAFETTAFRADNSPFDQYLRGYSRSLSRNARKGMALFYGRAGCGACHSGKFQTDHDFHAIAMPQIGPGKADGQDSSYWNATGINAVLEDFGRGRVTSRAEDNYKFRTPSLRNVATTGPWGHAGAYNDLEAVVRHHLDPVSSLDRYDATTASLPEIGEVPELTATGSRLSHGWMSDSRQKGFRKRDTWVQGNPTLRNKIANANELPPVSLSDKDVAGILAFLDALTDPSVVRLNDLVPQSVPSGLPVAD